MYENNGQIISLEEAQTAANGLQMSLDTWLSTFGWSATEGKTTVPEETTPPTEPVKTTAAGDSSLADTSLESLENNIPGFLSLEDIQGSEEEVKQKTQRKLRAIGIEVDEAVPFMDYINLSSLTQKNELGDKQRLQLRLTKNREEDLKQLNQFISQYADTSYAESLKTGREELLATQTAKIKNVKITDEDVKNSVINNWNTLLAEKQTKEMKASIGAPASIVKTSNTLNSADFKTNKEYNQYLNWLKTGDLEMSSEQIAELKPAVLAEEQNAISKEFTRNLEKDDREALETIAQYEAYKIETRAAGLEKEINDFNNEAINLQKDIDKFNANPTTPEEAIILKNRAAKILIQETDIKDFVDNLESDEAKALFKASEDLAKNYNMLAKLGVNFKKTGFDIGYGAFQIVLATGSLFTEGSIEGGVKLAEDIAEEAIRDITLEVEGFDEGVQFKRIGEGKSLTSDIINWAGNTAVQAIPSLTMAFTGSAAMPLFFASGYGSSMVDMANQEYQALDRIEKNMKLLKQEGISTEEMARLNEAIDKDAKIVNIPAWREMSTGAIAGLAEVAFERLGTMAILKGVNRATGIKNKEIAKSILKSANREGLTEGATELTNNFAKINILDEDINLFDNVAEAYFGGALIGGPLELKFAAPAVYANLAHNAMSAEEVRQYNNKIESLRKLTGIKNLESLLNNNTPLPKGLSEETKTLIKEIQTEGELIQDKAIEKLQKRLSFEEIKELGELNLKMRQINKRLIKAAESGATQSEITAIKEQLQNKFDTLSKQREALLTNVASQKEVAKNKTNLQASIDFATASNIVFNNEIQFKIINSNKAFDLLNKEEKSRRVKENNGNEEVAKTKFYLENNKNKLEEDYNRAQALNIENGKTATIKRMSNSEFKKAFPGEGNTAFFDKNTNEIFVNEDAAAAQGQVGVYTHEMFHAIVKETIGDGTANQVGEQLLNFLEKEAGDVFDYINNKLELLYKEGDKKDAAYYEEAITALSDYIAEGNTIELGALTQANRFLNKVLGKTSPGLSVTDGQQTFEFIVQYANKNRGKKAEDALRSFIKAGATEEDKTTEKAKRKASRSAAADRASAVLAKMQDEGFDPNSMELYESLQGMVGAQLSKYQAKGLQITDEEEAVSDVVARLYTQRDVNKFDGRGTLYGYLNGRIKFRILDALKANPVWVENFEDVDVEGLSGKAAREVTEETVEPAIKTETIADVTPVKEYKNLLRRRVVEPEVIKSIEEKVLRTVRLLKSRIDAKISKNVTVTPIIREVKKEMGKQADIDIKNAMGGKKDGELRKFLLRNKAAILENMPTTWLSQAMPFAIQKKVDGQWTTDWQGKKVDRESVTTDKAGRTSGADLVRRLPKVAGTISDSQFLESILEPSGNPIRGKKESLAKAIAEEMSFDIIKKSLEDANSEISKALIENQKRLGVENAENLGPEFVRQSERGNVKFNKKFNNKLWNELAVLSELSREEQVALHGESIDSILKSFNVESRFNLRSKEGVDEYIDFIIEHLVPNVNYEMLFPEGSRVGTSLLYNSKSVYQMTKSEFVYARDEIIKRIKNGIPKDRYASYKKLNEAWKKYQKNQKVKINSKTKDGKTTTNWLWKDYRTELSKNGQVVQLTQANLTGGKNAYGSQESLKIASENGDLLRYNVRNEFLYEYMWTNLNDYFQNNLKFETNAKGEKVPTKKSSDIIRGISTWMYLAQNDTTHPQRALASIVAWQDGYKIGEKIDEHALPNIAVTQTLLQAMMFNPDKFNMRFKLLQQNYVIVVLSKDADDKQNKAGYKTKKPEGWDILYGNWWDRMFNRETGIQTLGGTSERGIDPNSIILGSGNRLGNVIGVDKFGRIKNLFDFMLNNPLDFEEIERRRGKELTEDQKQKIYKKYIRLGARLEIDKQRFEDGQRKYSKGFPEPSILNAQFNAILRRKSGIDGRTEISRTRGQILGKDKGRFKFFIAPGADDFRGLVHYAFAGQGKQGEKDMEFFEKNLMDPYFRGIAAIDAMRQLIKREFKVVTTEFKDEYAKLSEPVPGTPFTYDHAVRVYMWGLAGTNVPGLSDKDRNDLENAILDNPALADFAEALLIVGRRETWPNPSEFWIGDSVLADLNSMTEKVGRKEILAQFITNVDAIFDEAALNKVEAIKGRKHREALEDAIYAMKNGNNRPSGANIQTNKWLNWINGSTGAIMFFNRRSALLQMLSFTNFINWSDNNPIKAAAAFANQKQYWKDFVFIFNSDKLKERRGGLKQDVSESEIAQVAGRSKNSPQAILAYILKLGFTPTQIADSFAIATGGASFYRNRINTYLKEGLSQKKAEEKAFEDFSKASDVAQQSSDPALVSQQQRSILGRLILAFANTPMQYTRLMKKAGQDLINGRGDAKAHISKILYYGAVQNFIFSALQSALFALFFDDDEEDDEKRKQNADKKLLRTVNSMVDTILRGSGIYGAVVSTIKNTIQTYFEQEDKKFMADHTYTVLSALNISPPIGSKFRKLYGAIQTRKFEKDAIAARGWALTSDGKLNLGPNWAILGSLVSGVANVPLDRIEAEISSIAEALDARNKVWQRIALALGWKTWDVGAKNEEEDLIETLAKEKRKEEGIKKRKETLRKKKEQKEKEYEKLSDEEKLNIEAEKLRKKLEKQKQKMLNQ